MDEILKLVTLIFLTLLFIEIAGSPLFLRRAMLIVMFMLVAARLVFILSQLL